MRSSKIRGFQTPSHLRHLPSLLPDPLDDVIFHQPSPFSQDDYLQNCFMVKLKNYEVRI